MTKTPNYTTLFANNSNNRFFFFLVFRETERKVKS